MKAKLFRILIIALPPVVFFFCSSTPVREKQARSVLPLAEGWYSYDFERKIKSIEDEELFFLGTGTRMIQETTLKQTGTITRFEEGIMYDPVLNTFLAIDSGGIIRGRDNPSIFGEIAHNGSFFWSGNVEEQGRLFHAAVLGKLAFLPPELRAGPEYDGVYRMTDQGTGREQVVKIAQGFYTWAYAGGGEAGFTPWPVLVAPDGSFSFEMDMTTVLVMGEAARANYSTGFAAQGQVIPGRGISMDMITHSAGAGLDQSGGAPQVYSGTALHSGEYPNEAVPPGVENIAAELAAEKKAVPFDWSPYPSWYRAQPVKAGYLYAAGTKPFSDEDTAFAMAEAAAAADLAVRLRVRIESGTVDIQNASGSRFESFGTLESSERIPYRVVEKEYRRDTGTAFVLVELNLADQ
jgi:hypothetical protein